MILRQILKDLFPAEALVEIGLDLLPRNSVAGIFLEVSERLRSPILTSAFAPVPPDGATALTVT